MNYTAIVTINNANPKSTAQLETAIQALLTKSIPADSISVEVLTQEKYHQLYDPNNEPYGRCDTCDALCNQSGCVVDPNHINGNIVDDDHLNEYDLDNSNDD